MITICKRLIVNFTNLVYNSLFLSLSLSEPISSSPVQYCHRCPEQSCHSSQWCPPDAWSDSAGDNHFYWSLQLCRSDPVKNPSIINSKKYIMEKYIRSQYLIAWFHQYYLNINFVDFIVESIHSNSDVYWNKICDNILKWQDLCQKLILLKSVYKY